MNEMRAVDLHVHSNRSDGTFSPTQLVDYAMEKGLAAFALTDHDTDWKKQSLMLTDSAGLFLRKKPGAYPKLFRGLNCLPNIRGRTCTL